MFATVGSGWVLFENVLHGGGRKDPFTAESRILILRQWNLMGLFVKTAMTYLLLTASL